MTSLIEAERIKVVTKYYCLWVVDDDADDHTFIKETIDGLGLPIHVFFYLNTIHALKDLEEGIKIPDAIISDINMPIMDGITFLERIKSIERLRHIPVIMHSTASTNETARLCYSLGAHSYILKGIDFTPLMETIRNLFGVD